MNTSATHSADPRSWVESVYERLAADDEGRVCKAIPDQACREVPGNFLRMLLANAASQVADSVASAKTTLPWLLMHLGAPAWMASLLVPIRESGSMLPQLFLGAAVRGLAVRKWVWVGCALVQAACLAALGWAALQLRGAGAGWAVLGLLVVFSLARAGCSIAYKDVQGKTIPKTRRGRLSGWIAAIAGALAMLVGLGLGALPDGGTSAQMAALLGLGALAWALAAWLFAGIREFGGATEGGVSGSDTITHQLALLRDDAPFRRFVVARALAMGSSLAAPFYVSLARDALGQAIALLGVFIAIEGLAGLVSSPVWGRMADRSSRKVFATASALAAVLSIIVAMWSWWSPQGIASTWFYPTAFFALGIAHAGVRLGRKTYLVDLAEGDRRTAYVAVSNSVIGVLLLATGALGALAASWSVAGTVMLLGLAGLAGAWMSLRWQEVSG
ncbi:MAG: MFS transporter [Rhodoferax sp.]|nr:MFS transporter [Rhodoferax sp.]